MVSRVPVGKSANDVKMDRLGIALSVLCLFHCLALPVILAVLPLIALSQLPEWMHETEWLHGVLLVPVFLVSGPVLLRASRERRWFLPVAVLAFTALTTALFVEGEFAEVALTVTGAILLFIAHWSNLKNGKGQYQLVAGENPSELSGKPVHMPLVCRKRRRDP